MEYEDYLLGCGLICVAICLLKTSSAIIRVTLSTIRREPLFTLKAIAMTLISTAAGYYYKGHVTVEIALFGFVGLMLYILFLLIVENKT